MCHGYEKAIHRGINPMPFIGILNHFKGYFQNFEGWIPHYIEEFETYYMIVVPLPGFAKEDVEINLISNSININGKKKEAIPEQEQSKSPEQKESKYPRSHFIKEIFDRLWNKGFNLEISLPDNVNKEDIKSKLVNGLLKIKLGKKEPEKINIDIENNN